MDLPQSAKRSNRQDDLRLSLLTIQTMVITEVSQQWYRLVVVTPILPSTALRVTTTEVSAQTQVIRIRLEPSIIRTITSGAVSMAIGQTVRGLCLLGCLVTEGGVLDTVQDIRLVLGIVEVAWEEVLVVPAMSVAA